MCFACSMHACMYIQMQNLTSKIVAKLMSPYRMANSCFILSWIVYSSRRCTLNPKILYTSPQTHYCWVHLYVPAIYHNIEHVLIQSTITSLYNCSNLGTELACMWFVHLQYVYTHDARQNITSMENTASSVGYRRCHNYECQIHNAPETQSMYIHLPSTTVYSSNMYEYD